MRYWAGATIWLWLTLSVLGARRGCTDRAQRSGHEIKIAVECRDHARDQNMGWIDSLKGKFSRLKVNQIVAVSSSRFSDSAKTKAAGRLIGSVCRGVGRAGDL